MKNLKSLINILLFIVVIGSTNLFADELNIDSESLNTKVLIVKDKQLLIGEIDPSLQSGSKFFILNENNEKIALVKVIKTKDKRALCEIIKGSPVVGQKAQYVVIKNASKTKVEESEFQKKSTKETEAITENKKNFKSNTNKLQGVMFSLAIPSISALEGDVAGNSENVKLAGSSMSLNYFYEKSFLQYFNSNASDSNFKLQLNAGLKTISTKGTSTLISCADQTSTECTFGVTYLDFGANIKHNFYTNSWGNFYYQIGPKFLMPIIKKSTAFIEQNITFNSNALLSLGTILNTRMALIPLEVSYIYHPQGADIKFTEIQFSIGYAWK
jgi:hypothetical protein